MVDRNEKSVLRHEYKWEERHFEIVRHYLKMIQEICEEENLRIAVMQLYGGQVLLKQRKMSIFILMPR